MGITWQGFEGKLRHWDVTFWAERLREARYELTDEQLRPYFALPNVLDGLFQARAAGSPALAAACWSTTGFPHSTIERRH